MVRVSRLDRLSNQVWAGTGLELVVDVATLK